MKGYRHRTVIRVRNFEVDWQGIVHNAVYLQYFETGRFEYLRAAGYQVDLLSVNRKSRVVLARNEIDYLYPASFDEELEVFTKVSLIGNKSYIFKGVIRNVKTQKLISRNNAVHVWLTQRTGKPRKIPRDFVKIIEAYQGRAIPRKVQ
jgi:acyl-CoA thioester hydrolase